MTDVFISYAREDLERVRPLVVAIEGAGYEVFWDRMTPAGLTWRQFIGKALDEARCVVVVWSASSIGSDWVIDEADDGHRRKILIPITIEDVMPPLGFRALQHEDLNAWDGDPDHPRIQRLLASIARVTGKPQITKQESPPTESETAPLPVESPPPKKSAKNHKPDQARKPGFLAKPGAILVAVTFIAAMAFSLYLGLGDRQRQAPDEPIAAPPSTSTDAKTPVKAQKDENPEKASENVTGAAAINGARDEPDAHAGKATNEVPQSYTNQIGMKFALVPAGAFMMGIDKSRYEQPVHRVSIQKPFYIQTTEVTQAQWMTVMGENPSSFRDCGPDCPVEKVGWDEVHTFIRKLNALTGEQYRLPTEAEWEYAARSGGDNQTYAGGENLDDLGWYTLNSGNRTHPVGQKQPNGLGLYDMSGNVWEWVEDDWHYNYQNAPVDGSAWIDDPRLPNRVIRGGGWYDDARSCRSVTRNGLVLDERHSRMGFRLSRSVTLDP